ncbi:hypothetical protein DIPPA_12075 [Diplonema papillatum]|nr:hypothetical protein DIPPA_12075 [Diplonema papillatum]|eukprot:gene7580-11606_t
MAFYAPVGPRTCGLKSAYTKQRLKDYEHYMSGYGGGKPGHKFVPTPSNDMYIVRQTTWMDMRFDSGWGDWFQKMGRRTWRRSKYFYPPVIFGVMSILIVWEWCVAESQRYEKMRWH